MKPNLTGMFMSPSRVNMNQLGIIILFMELRRNLIVKSKKKTII